MTDFVVTDENVHRLYPEHEADFVLPAGESAKQMVHVESILHAMTKRGLRKADTLCAIGGGCVTDTAGLAAALYQRGMNLYLEPTTLIGMVDAAWGGKNGVNHGIQGFPGFCKNFYGTIYPPVNTTINTDYLDTLPAKHLSSGWAEIIKTALIVGGTLWNQVRAVKTERAGLLVHVVAEAKTRIIREQERDLLNLGHTFGHAFEAQGGLTHGEAVGLGLMCALMWCSYTLRDEVGDLLERHGLSRSITPPDRASYIENVLGAMARDKKDGLVLPVRVGEVFAHRQVNPDFVRTAVESVVA